MGYLFGALNATIADRFMMGPALTLSQIVKISPSMLVWSWSNLFLFNLHNQRHDFAITEDALNKPWRPLPSGRLTAHQATQIMYFMYPVVLSVAFTTGGMIPCLLEMVFCLWYNEWSGAANPFIKNILNGLGFASFYSGPLEVATGRSVFAGGGEAAIWLAILATSITFSSHLQDFRDMDGDRAAGRRTVPLTIGDINARLTCVLTIFASNSVACWFWGSGWIDGILAWVAGVAIMGNLLLDRTTKGDIFSWKLFPVWMLGLFLLPILGK
ncbi:UbiA prenyltransferase family-domain-containing protein [Annulohypoxylon bovei var. microspora]|nr:UbiA prenyltransferase family-domain-containing protein [Annulohypoxylon bovei var. microspora]